MSMTNDNPVGGLVGICNEPSALDGEMIRYFCGFWEKQVYKIICHPRSILGSIRHGSRGVFWSDIWRFYTALCVLLYCTGTYLRTSYVDSYQ